MAQDQDQPRRFWNPTLRCYMIVDEDGDGARPENFVLNADVTYEEDEHGHITYLTSEPNDDSYPPKSDLAKRIKDDLA